MLEPLFNSAAVLKGRGGGGGPVKPVTLLKRDPNTGAFLLSIQIFETIINSAGHETIYFEKYLRTAASQNLSDAAILIFRRYFRSSSLVGVLQSKCS